MKGPAKTEARPRDALAGSARMALWGLALWSAATFAASLLARSATAATAVQAAIAEWGTAQMGITWSPPMAPPPTWRAIAKRASVGAGYGAAVAAAAVVAALLARTAILADGPKSFDVLLVGLALAALSAVRDELLLRGVTLRVTRDVLPVWVGLLACAGAGACARFGVDGHVSVALAYEAMRGAALGALWVRDRGAWMAVGANVGFTWTADSLLRGGALDVRYAGEVATDGPTLAIVAFAALGAALLATRGSRSQAATRSVEFTGTRY